MTRRTGLDAPRTRWSAASTSAAPTHERTTVADALDRYEREVVPLKKASTQAREGARIREVKAFFGQYSLAAVSPDLVAEFRDKRLAQGKANNTVRLELALLGHMFSTAIKEWHMGLTYNPVSNVRKPSPGQGRNRRLVGDEQQRLLAAVAEHCNPMLGWIVRLAIETGMRQSGILNLKRHPGAVRTQRHVPTSITSLRHRLSYELLSRAGGCPCCGRLNR